MKTALYNEKGEKSGEIDLPKIFSANIRDDIAQKFFETEKIQQPFSPFFKAGKRHSASGNIRHARRKWKTAYGKGISRVPRKIMWRRGSQFYWIGAEISSARGGRRSHPPKTEHFINIGKINKKEKEVAFASGIASTASSAYVKKRYPNFSQKVALPIVIPAETLKLKAKELTIFFNMVLKDSGIELFKNKSVRPGKGKMRNRRYRKNSGILIVTGKDENKTINGIDMRQANKLEMKDLYPLGRLTIYTEKGLKEIGGNLR